MITIEQYDGNNKLIKEAITFATEKHASQTRKGSGLPYIIHPMEVWMILRENNCSSDVQIAGLLHDTLEDTDATPEMIEAKFGKKILELVKSESEDKSKTWKERKQHTIDHLSQSSIETMMVCCADKLSNCRAQLYDYNQIGDALFDRFSKESNPELQSWYYNGIVYALKPLEGMKMYKELKDVVHKVYKNKYRFPGLKFDVSCYSDSVFMSVTDKKGYINPDMAGDTYSMDIDFEDYCFLNSISDDIDDLDCEVDTFMMDFDRELRNLLPDAEEFDSYELCNGYWKCMEKAKSCFKKYMTEQNLQG